MKTEEEADEPTRMFTGDIGDFIKKKREYEDVPEEDAYEEILQSWERKRKEKKIKREREGKDPYTEVYQREAFLVRSDSEAEEGCEKNCGRSRCICGILHF